MVTVQQQLDGGTPSLRCWGFQFCNSQQMDRKQSRRNQIFTGWQGPVCQQQQKITRVVAICLPLSPSSSIELPIHIPTMSRLARVVPANGTPTRSGGTGSASGSANATPTRIPRRRGPITYSPTADNDNEEGGSTPGPVKARIDNLMSQVQELLRKQHAAEVSLCF
jgi:hypothetical protein